MSEKLHSNDNKAREQKCIKACRLRQRIVDKGGDSLWAVAAIAGAPY